MESIEALISKIHESLSTLKPGSTRRVSPQQIVKLAAGDVLFTQGDSSDAVYLVTSGELVVSIQGIHGSETEVNRHQVGAMVGEMAAMTNQPRSATVYAATDATLECIDKATFKKLILENDEFVSALTQLVTQRWRQSALAEVLAERFRPIEPAFWRELGPRLKWRHLSAGETLCQQGDPSHCLYIVVSGRLRLRVTEGNDTERDIGEVVAGETVGEFGLLTHAPRSATVYAIRETNVVELSPEGFELLLQRYPSVLRDIVKIIAERQQRSISFGQRSQIAAFALALVPVSPHLDLEDFAVTLARVWPHPGNALVLSSQRFDALYGYPGASQATFNDPIHPSIVAWMGKQESQHQLLLYIADFEWSGWTRRCLNQADQVLMIADPEAVPRPTQTEKAISQLPTRLRTDLVLWHRPGTTQPQGTAAWLDRAEVDAHHQIRRGEQAHMAGLARRLSGNAVCLVLSGGGARGFAHVGVFRAMTELGIPIDYIGGTSVGAAVAGSIGLGGTYAQLIDQMRVIASTKELLDYTLPFTSLMTSGKITRRCQWLFEEIRIEDMWMPFFCISANLSQATQVVHRRGPLWQAVRTSMSIPGVFTPVMVDGDILVDGGVINNFPVDVMAALSGSQHLIGVNASPTTIKQQDYDIDFSLSGWRILADRMKPKDKRLSTPSLIETLMRTHEVRGIHQARHNEQLVDLLIYPDVSHIGLLEFDNYEKAVAAGYEAALDSLCHWQRDKQSLFRHSANRV